MTLEEIATSLEKAYYADSEDCRFYAEELREQMVWVENLRQRNIERHEKQHQKCSCCQSTWAYTEPERHAAGCIITPRRTSQ